MNKIVLLALLLFSIVNVSCKKKIDVASAKYLINNPTSYILKKQTWTGVSTNGEAFSYVYNNDHVVSSIERYQWGGGPSQTWYDTAYYTFEYAKGLCTKWKFDEGGSHGYFVYEYNERNLPVKRTLFDADNNVQGYDFYRYDNAGNLIEKIDSSKEVDFKYEFKYDKNNNLISLINYILWSTPQQKIKYDYLTFDNKVNFIKAVNGLPLTFEFENNYGSYSSSSPDNLVSENYYVPVNIDQPFGAPNFTNYTYEYNEEGLPTRMLYGPWIVTFEYEKYK